MALKGHRAMVIGGAGVAWVALVVGMVFSREPEPSAYAAPGYGPLTATQILESADAIVPRMLGVVYEAFEETNEAAIYDQLAKVSAGHALEELYLERMGAMAGGGLSDPDQEVHEIELVSLDSERAGETISMTAKWRVLGTVGHAEHLHVRGNAYAAALALEPAEGAWRLTGFNLTDVDRSDAGTMQARASSSPFALKQDGRP